MSEYLYLPDIGGGMYQNPVLFCDYSDPDCICVDGVYYMTASSFNYVPGLPILISRDLVNWTLTGYALRSIPGERYAAPCHAQGVWAPAIRYHEGVFYILYGQPDEGIYMVRSADRCRNWEEPVLILPGKGLIDPCPFWDQDGRAYVIHAYAKSRIGFNSWLGIFPITPDCTQAIGEDRLLYDGTVRQPTIEGPKVYRRGEWYYIFAPAGGVDTGWQTVLRSRSIMGPYEDRIVLQQGDSDVNGPHQGAWVETPTGDSWFLHFQSRGLYGRVTHLQPMRWEDDGWPVLGSDGEPVDVWEKPEAPASEPVGMVGSDDFEGPLGLQWQFMGNCRPDFYEVGEGRLRLFARMLPFGGGSFWECPQVCTQKVAAPAFFAQTTVDISGLQPGDQAGVALVGGAFAYAALRRTQQGLSLAYVESVDEDHREAILDEVTGLPEHPVTLRLTLLPTGDAEAVATFEFAVDGGFRVLGRPFEPARHTWVGARLGLFSMPMDGGPDRGGYADFGPLIVEAVETL